MRNILYVASEAVPFIKTGGLADVIGALPKACDKTKYDCRVMLPKYSCINECYASQMQFVGDFLYDYNGFNRKVTILETEYEGIKFYFLDDGYFWGDVPYAGGERDIEKFIFYDRIVLEAIKRIDFRPDVIHCNDWQTGLIPVLLKANYACDEFYANTKTVITIHNLKFQGAWNMDVIKYFSGLDDSYFTADKLECNGGANMLKGGIVYADAITTVSESYAEEIKTPYYGEGLDGLMSARSNALRGIVNGIDYDTFNPETDRLIYKNYNSKNFKKNKPVNKLELQKQFGLEVTKDKFLIGMVSRLTSQKGLDLVKYVLDEIMEDDTQLVVLGTGDYEYEEAFRDCAGRMPGKVAVSTCYSEDIAHKIYAGSDAFLMPSLFEPCGLSQLIALQYGSVPIVRETGGLRDTVEPYNEYEGTGTGFSFSYYNAHDMLHVIDYAKDTYFRKRKEWDKIVERGMNTDFSWKKSAIKYQELYDSFFE